MILQMMGRAGRQQYNTSGRVYIMTNDHKVVSESKRKQTISYYLMAQIAANFIEDKIIAHFQKIVKQN